MTMGRILLLLAVFTMAMVQARAAPLDADTCAKLLEEHGQLEQAGVEADMAKGPEWAKANLIPEKIERIRRFIEVEGQLLFRCRQKSLVNLPQEIENDPAGDGKDKKAESPRVPPDAAGKTKAPAATKKKSTQPAKKAAVQPAAKPAPKPAPKPTKKAPSTGKPPAKANAAAKQPADTKVGPAPSAGTAKRVPKAKDED